MVIIFTLGNQFWIEAHIVARANISATTTNLTTITLDRAGQFLAISATPSTSNSNIPRTKISVAGVGAGDLSVGQDITQVEIRRRNDDSVVRSLGVQVVIFMRGSGH